MVVQVGSFQRKRDGGKLRERQLVVKVKLPDQNVLVLDIEWRPTKAYVWGAFKENIFPEKIIEHGGLLCVGAKWLGNKEFAFFSDWKDGHEGMLKGIWEMMAIADAIVTYNGDKYDLAKLNGEFAINGLPPVPPSASIDLYKQIKKFGLFMNRLAFVGPLFGLGKKIEHEGFALWVKVEAGDVKAQGRMERYCIQDVRLTERLYLKIRSHIRNHPHLGKTAASECPSCGGKHTHSRGKRRTRSFSIARLQCQDCGHWFDGVRKKI